MEVRPTVPPTLIAHTIIVASSFISIANPSIVQNSTLGPWQMSTCQSPSDVPVEPSDLALSWIPSHHRNDPADIWLFGECGNTDDTGVSFGWWRLLPLESRRMRSLSTPSFTRAGCHCASVP